VQLTVPYHKLRLAADAAAFDSRAGHSNRLDQKGSRRWEQARRRTNPRTVFYVDDNPKALRILTFALEWAGYKVVTACNAEALERMKQTSSDLVLLAYRTPQMIGSKLTTQTGRGTAGALLRKLSPST
jgi:PleD family two-component response regulator